MKLHEQHYPNEQDHNWHDEMNISENCLCRPKESHRSSRPE